MKITSVRTWIADLPVEQPFTHVGEQPNARRPFVLLQLLTDDGLEGIGVTTFGGALTRTLRSAVEELGALIVGDDPLGIERIRRKLRLAAATSGPEGIFTLALASIDIALWDIKGKALGQPLWRLLGGSGSPVATYASGALVRQMSDDDVATAAQRIVDGGFREMKMHLAVADDCAPAADLRRARLVREVIGPDVKLMADVNQRWRVDQALAIGRQLEPFDFVWLEDVVVAQDWPGLARVAAALRTPLASGEFLWGLGPFRDLIAARATDFVMIDLARAGGITAWLKIAALAEAANLPVISHLLPEIHVHLIGAIPNGRTVEHMPWSFRLYQEVPLPVGGLLPMPTEPGLGLRLDHDALKHYAPAR